MGWFKRVLCGHVVSSEMRSDKKNTKKKRHYHYCKKCDKRWYLD